MTYTVHVDPSIKNSILAVRTMDSIQAEEVGAQPSLQDEPVKFTPITEANSPYVDVSVLGKDIDVPWLYFEIPWDGESDGQRHQLRGYVSDDLSGNVICELVKCNRQDVAGHGDGHGVRVEVTGSFKDGIVLNVLPA